jgi:hypothetical protein
MTTALTMSRSRNSKPRAFTSEIAQGTRCVLSLYLSVLRVWGFDFRSALLASRSLLLTFLPPELQLSAAKPQDLRGRRESPVPA